jgi:phage FluMu gp28-like protein
VLLGALVSLLAETWRISRLAVDATGVGETLAGSLKNRLGDSRVEAVKFTAEMKSRLGYRLLAAVNSGRLRLYEAPVSGEATACWHQIERCRAVYRPNQTLNFFVEARDGHDDYVISLALVVAASADATPRAARGRPGALNPVYRGREW